MSDYLPIAGSRGAVPGLAIIQADQTTIVGDGTSELPLRAGSGTLSGTFLGQDTTEGLLVGYFVQSRPDVVVDPELPGVTALTFADYINPVAGIVTSISVVDEVQICTVQTYGTVQLTISQWESVGLSGGLIRGAPYFMNTTTPGFITDIQPVVGAINRVGIALNPTTMLLSGPVQPQEI